MAQQSALSTAQLDTIRTGHFSGQQYLLIWDAPIIFQAQINQATFESSFATVTYNNVTIGAYTDIKADFVCYIGSVAGDLKNAQQKNLRIRANSAGTVATATAIYINETSASLTDDWYIMVVKDVRCETKLPRTISDGVAASNTYPRDYEISTWRNLKPIVYNLQSAYIGVLNSDGYVDFTLAPLGLVTDADATVISTWFWDIDGMDSFQVGDEDSQNITARATATGQYMPRVTITDDDGNTNYFTFRVWVVPADLSSVVNLSFGSAKITRDNVNGDTCIINANIADASDSRLRIDNLIDYSFVAVWWKSNQPILTSDIVFIGRFSSEVVKQDNVTLQERMGIPLFNTNFEIDGVATQMGDVISRRLPIIEDAAPDTFGQVKTLTPWRALVYFLTEHSTIMNVHAFKFGDTTDDYRWPRFSTGDSSALASAQDILFTINATLNYRPTGEVNVNRMAWYLDDTARDALTVVANYTVQDMATSESGGPMYTYSRKVIPQIGRLMAGGAFYNSTTKKEQITQAITPAVAQSRGTSLATLNRQVLKANQTISAASDEMGQRTTDDVEARQPQTTLNVTHPSAHWFQSPDDAAWYTWTISAATNNRGISCTTSNRWTLRRVSLDFDLPNGKPIVSAEYKLETQGGDWQTLVTTPIEAGPNYFNPVVPVAPVYDIFPENPGNAMADSSASGQSDPDNQPPFDADDSKIVNSPTDPSVALANPAQPDGRTGMIWDSTTLWRVENMMTVPIFTDATPSIGSETIQNAKYKKGSSSPAAWLLTASASATTVWRAAAITHSAWLEDAADIEGQYTLIREVPGLASQDRVYIYAPSGSEGHKVVSVAASASAGIATGIEVSTGDSIAFVATGTWYYGVGPSYLVDADGDDGVRHETAPMPGENIGALIGQVAGGAYFLIGISETVVADATGEVTLWMNDAALGYTDNSGSVSVDINPDASASSRRSLNNGLTFAEARLAGPSPDGAPLGGFDGYFLDDMVYAATDEQIRKSTNNGAYADVVPGDTSGTYAKAILFVGNDDYLVASAAVVDGTESLWIVINGGTATDITPNDGEEGGIVVSAEGLEAHSRYPGVYLALMDFGGTVKLAYTTDYGVTWAFNTQVSNDACHIAASVNNGIWRIFVADAATMWVGIWDGTGTITLTAKTTPATALLGVESR